MSQDQNNSNNAGGLFSFMNTESAKPQNETAAPEQQEKPAADAVQENQTESKSSAVNAGSQKSPARTAKENQKAADLELKKQYETYVDAVSRFEAAEQAEPGFRSRTVAAERTLQQKIKAHDQTVANEKAGYVNAAQKKIDALLDPIDLKIIRVEKEQKEANQVLTEAKTQLAADQEKLRRVNEGYSIPACDKDMQGTLGLMYKRKWMSKGALSIMDMPKEEFTEKTKMSTSFMETLESEFTNSDIWKNIVNAVPTAQGVQRASRKFAMWYLIIGLVFCLLAAWDTPLRTLCYPIAGIAIDIGFSAILYLVYIVFTKKNGWGLFAALLVFNILNFTGRSNIYSDSAPMLLFMKNAIFVVIGYFGVLHLFTEKKMITFLKKFKWVLAEEYIQITQYYEKDGRTMTQMYCVLHHDILAPYVEQEEQNTNRDVLESQIVFNEKRIKEQNDALQRLGVDAEILQGNRKKAGEEVDAIKQQLQKDVDNINENSRVKAAKMQVILADSELSDKKKEEKENTNKINHAIDQIRAWDKKPTVYSRPILNDKVVIRQTDLTRRPEIMHHDHSATQITYSSEDKNLKSNAVLKDFMYQLTYGLQRINPAELLEVHFVDLFGNGSALAYDEKFQLLPLNLADDAAGGKFGPGVWLHKNSSNVDALNRYLDKQETALRSYVTENRGRNPGLTINIAAVNENIKTTSDGTSRVPFTYKVVVVFLPREAEANQNSGRADDLLNKLTNADFCRANGIIPVFAVDQDVVPVKTNANAAAGYSRNKLDGRWITCLNNCNVKYSLNVRDNTIRREA